MKGRAAKSHAALDLVASDLFLGLGAVMLVVVAALSLGLQDMVTRLLPSQNARPGDTRDAATALTATTGLTVLLADEAGLHHLKAGSGEVIALDDLWKSDRLEVWFAEEPLLIIAPSGQEVAFLTYSRASQSHPAPLLTLRLPHDCRELRQTGPDFQCLP